MRNTVRMIGASLAVIAAMVVFPADPFYADIFQVTKTEDTDDNACDTDCSLREAIAAANTNPGADGVLVPAGFYLLTLGQLAVSDGVSIAGAGQASTILDGNAADTVFEIEAETGTVVEISDVTIQNGNAFRGGGISSKRARLALTNSKVSGNTATNRGGGIYTLAALSLTDSTVSGNTAQGYGGGIYSDGNLSLTDSAVSGNTARKGGGIWSGFGGGGGDGTLTLTNSTVSWNSAVEGGGGVASTGASVTLTNSTVSGNTARKGGGIWSRYSSWYGPDLGHSRTWPFNPLTVTNSTVSGNTAVGYGGGIYSDGALSITNSTVSGNTARVGGGIESEGALSITNSTVSGNTARSFGGGFSGYSAVTATFFNTIVARNSAPSAANCDNYWLVMTSLGHNLTDDASCSFAATGDLVVADAMLGPLADNGGPTRTHALLPGSPAIDAGDASYFETATEIAAGSAHSCAIQTGTGNVVCWGANFHGESYVHQAVCPTTDQRGVARPQGAACDIGAFELEIEAITVEIDIRPGSDSNPINRSGRGGIPVAILGSDTFEVRDVDVMTLAFGASAATPSHDLTKPGVFEDHLQDVNGDGLTDLVSHYRTQEAGITADDLEACITGATLDGTPFEGCDSIRTLRGRRGIRR